MSEIIVKIEIAEEPVNVAIAATEVGGGASTYAGLTDAATADLPAINAPLAAALAAAGSDVAADTHAAASKATPVDADEVPLVDSAAAFSLGKLTWANLKATLATYFGGIFAAKGVNSDITRLTGLSAGSLVISWGDADSGLYANDSKSIGYRYDGVEKFRLDANGFVISGVAGAASRTLTVFDGSTTFTAGLSAANTQCFGFGDLLGGALGRFERNTGTGLIEFKMQAASSASLGIVAGHASATFYVKTAAGATANSQEWRNSAGSVIAAITSDGSASVKGLTTAGPVSLLKSGSSDLFSFDFLNVYFAPGSALEFRTKLGSGATGDALFQAASPVAARETLRIIRRAMESDALATSATPVSAPDLTFPLEAGKLYRVDLNLIVQSVGAVGYQVTVTYPTNARTGVGFSQTIHNSTAKFPNLGATSTTLNPNTTGNPNATIGVSGWVYLRPTASGNVTFSAAQQTGGTGTVGLLTGSMITVTEL